MSTVAVSGSQKVGFFKSFGQFSPSVHKSLSMPKTPFLALLAMSASAYEKVRPAEKTTPRYLYWFTTSSVIPSYSHFSLAATCPPFLTIIILEDYVYVQHFLKCLAVAEDRLLCLISITRHLQTVIIRICIRLGDKVIPCFSCCSTSLASSLIRRENKIGLQFLPCLGVWTFNKIGLQFSPCLRPREHSTKSGCNFRPAWDRVNIQTLL